MTGWILGVIFLALGGQTLDTVDGEDTGRVLRDMYAQPVMAEQSEACGLSPHHGGPSFSVDQVDRKWSCRLQSVISDYTTMSTVGPIRVALSESMYLYLLDRPPLAAGLINRLDLGLYQSEVRGPDRFWGDDGEGTKGIAQLVYQDAAFGSPQHPSHVDYRNVPAP